jgi:hypothetical protein
MTNRNSNRSWLTTLWPALAIMTLLAVGWLVYRPALSGTFLLDDASNLGDLSTVTDFESAMNFALSGSGGPLGRPLALATFAPQAPDWDSNAAAFLSVNVLIHLLNGFLLYLFTRQLARELRLARNDAEFLALATAACWLLMPLLASSTLMIVQRMTTLSATFVLGGLNGYLFARRSLDASPNAALAGMSSALVVATLLAVLTKENGALLPVFVLVMEITLLAQPRQLPVLRWKAWLSAFLLAPTLLIVIFLLIQASYSDNMIVRRVGILDQCLFCAAGTVWPVPRCVPGCKVTVRANNVYCGGLLAVVDCRSNRRTTEIPGCRLCGALVYRRPPARINDISARIVFRAPQLRTDHRPRLRTRLCRSEHQGHV